MTTTMEERNALTIELTLLEAQVAEVNLDLDDAKDGDGNFFRPKRYVAKLQDRLSGLQNDIQDIIGKIDALEVE